MVRNCLAGLASNEHRRSRRPAHRLEAECSPVARSAEDSNNGRKLDTEFVAITPGSIARQESGV